jgi:SAM-dependent methyltransferase
MEVVRTHDKMYLDEDRKKNPKECFKFVEEIAAPYLKSIDNLDILDIGCATGDQLWFLNTKYPEATFTGLDVMPDLLEKAKAEVPSADFKLANIFTGEGLPQKKFDAVFMSGVNSCFEEIEPWMDNVINLTKSGGEFYIFGLFNPENLDVLIKSKNSGDKTNKWETGWNVFSKKSFELFLEEKRLRSEWHDFSLKIDLEKNEKDPYRSWTRKLENGEREVINGLQLLHQFSLLRVFVP